MSNGSKTQLTPHEKVMAYIANRLHGVDQHLIASMYDTNQGRIAEAVTAIEYAIENTIEVCKLARGKSEPSQSRGELLQALNLNNQVQPTHGARRAGP